MEKARTKVQWALRGALLIALASQISVIWPQDEAGRADLSAICDDEQCTRMETPRSNNQSNNPSSEDDESSQESGSESNEGATIQQTTANDEMETECVSGNCDQVGPVETSASELVALTELVTALTAKVDSMVEPAQETVAEETADVEASDDPYVRCETVGNGDNSRLASRAERTRCLIQLISEFDVEKDLYGETYETSEDFLLAVEGYLTDIEADLEELVMSEDPRELRQAESLTRMIRTELTKLFTKAARAGMRMNRDERDQILDRYHAMGERIEYSRERNRIAEETHQAQSETQILAEEMSAIDNEMVRMAMENAKLAAESGNPMMYNSARMQLAQIDRSGAALQLHDQWLGLMQRQQQLKGEAYEGLRPQNTLYEQFRNQLISADTWRLYGSNYNSLMESIGRIGNLELAGQAAQTGGTIANTVVSSIIQPGTTIDPQFAILRGQDQPGFARGAFLLNHQSDPYMSLLNDFHSARMQGSSIQSDMYNSLLPTAAASRIPSEGGSLLQNGGLPYRRIPQAGQPAS